MSRFCSVERLLIPSSTPAVIFAIGTFLGAMASFKKNVNTPNSFGDIYRMLIPLPSQPFNLRRPKKARLDRVKIVNFESCHIVTELRNKMQYIFGREAAAGESRQGIASK